MDLHYAFVHRFTFQRPAYLRVLALLLVLLVTAAAGFAVFLRPLQELVLSAGGLILDVWGVRSIISPNSQAFVSAIDLSSAGDPVLARRHYGAGTRVPRRAVSFGHAAS